MTMRSFLVAVVCSGLVACGSDPEPDDPDGAPPIDARVDAPPDPTVVETRTVRIGPLTIPAGEEQTVCIVVDLGNEVPRMIRRVSSTLTEGTHHVIATKSAAAPTAAPSPCGPFAGGSLDSAVLTIAQQSNASLSYPDGAGLPITAHQSIHLEMHYVNASDELMMIGGTVDLDLAADNADLRPVALLFTGNASLNIPAGGTTSVTSFHSLDPGVQLFATTAHTHQWGTRATVELAEGSAGAAISLLHDSTNWAERPLDNFAPITIGAGQGLRLTCNFFNQSAQDVGFGLSANDEMCFVWAHLTNPLPQ